MIDPSIWADEDFGNLSSEAQVLFIGMVSNADDEGRLPGNAVFLISTIFPFRAYTKEEARKLRDEVLKRMKSVKLYEKDEKEYIQLEKFSNYQSIDRPSPSKYPPFSEGSASNRRPLVPNRREEKGIEEKIYTHFDSFWKEYPKKVSKSVAQKQFVKLNPSLYLLKKIMEDIRQRKESEDWQKQKGEFIPYPATYLNQRRWEDETKPGPRKPKAFYRGDPMIWSEQKKKWFVIKDGEWLEYAGTKDEIEWK